MSMETTPRTVTLIPGDAIGPELAAVVREVLAAAGAGIVWEVYEIGETSMSETFYGLDPALVASIRKNRVALKGRLRTPKALGVVGPTIALRRTFDLYCNIRPIRNIPGLASRYHDLDLVIIRENMEGEYAGLEHTVVPGVVESLKVITKQASERIARFAFEYARSHDRKRVTTIHKANIMKLSDGLFLETSRQVAREFPEIEHDAMIVDNACMQFVLNPHRFDVLLMGNLYGDILSDIGCALVGGISAAPSISRGDEFAIFEMVHGNAPELVGKNLANPLPMLIPAIYMLRHLGKNEVAERIYRAVCRVLEAGIVTRDLGGSATTTEMTGAIIAALEG